MPDDWKPNDQHRATAVERGLNLDRAVETFKAHAEANDRRLVDWDAGFRQWLAKERPGSNVHPFRPTGEDPNAWMRRTL
jgi:hypothetical protein